MSALHLLLDGLQQAAATAPDSTAPSFSLRWMGKSLFTISFCAILVIFLSGKAAWRLLRRKTDDRLRVGFTVDSVLFWGAFAFVLGVFHSAMGLIVTSISVARAAPVVPEAHGLIATGVSVALAAGAYGSLVFMLAALLWFGFRYWHLMRFS